MIFPAFILYILIGLIPLFCWFLLLLDPFRAVYILSTSIRSSVTCENINVDILYLILRRRDILPLFLLSLLETIFQKKSISLPNICIMHDLQFFSIYMNCLYFGLSIIIINLKIIESNYN